MSGAASLAGRRPLRLASQCFGTGNVRFDGRLGLNFSILSLDNLRLILDRYR